ncbi:DivIVA domain-containing protein [Allosaccharopolyspora coralli]|uniref:Cell wall synthesis protein Wag31 n=1 Tax=Allosaccharopolyspora coralli TaxID=2665642 RepID=A0A5Q3Q7S8_9PSEU|nr:DivIVA domain-containing protein [Allosaccharopolyspora coralli]QGK70542.1 DivIVA domain-containing protein [Allosaccharopolyspora coralli]
MTVTAEEVRLVDFPRPWRRAKGYDESEVDDFLDRIEATLLRQDTVSAEDVLAVRFSPKQRGKRGYLATSVDAFLEKVALDLIRRKNSLTGHTTTLTPVAPDRPALTAGPSSPHAPRPSLPAGPEPTPADDGKTSNTKPPRPQGSPVRPTALPQPPPTTASAGEPTFDADEVDRFVERVEATLRGQDTLTADGVLAARFHSAQPGRRGYSESNVNAFMVVLATSLQQLSQRRDRSTVPSKPAPASGGARMMTADDVNRATLSSPPPDRHGYRLDDVDAFLDRIEDTLRGVDQLTAGDVRNARFRVSPPGRGGYDPNEVESFLRLIERQLDGAQRRQLGA